MGLDTYAVKPEQDADGQYLNADAEDFAQVGMLTGGMFSGNGNDGSFRGKAYSHWVQEATGQSLYQEYIPPAIVATMADGLNAWEPDEFDEADEALPALRQFFAVCKDKGYGLVGWW